MKSEKETQKEINKEVKKWRKSKDDKPLVFDFGDGKKIIIVKAA